MTEVPTLKDRGTRAVLAVGQGAAGAWLLFIPQRLMWAWFEPNEPADRTGPRTYLHAGRPGIALIAIGAAALVLASAQVLSRASWLPAASLAVGVVGFVVAIASAAEGVAHANSSLRDGGGTTSYANGGGYAALAAVAIAACALIQLIRARSGAESPEDLWLRTRRYQVDPPSRHSN